MSLRSENKNIYWAWKAMKQRCKNPNCKAYKNYGERGIKVCEEWEEFEPFLSWSLSNGYSKGLDLDRKDNDGNYTPDNCRWISREENINNRRNTIKISVNGETLPETVWARKIGVDRALIKYWIRSNGERYAEKRISEILENGYTPKDYGYSHRKPVRHLESGKTFPSIREAAKYFKITPFTISNALRQNRATCKGRFELEETSETSGNVVRQKGSKKPKNIYFSMYSNYWKGKCENGS